MKLAIIASVVCAVLIRRFWYPPEERRWYDYLGVTALSIIFTTILVWALD